MDKITVRQLLQTIVLECYDEGDPARDKILVSIETPKRAVPHVEFELVEEQLKRLHDGCDTSEVVDVPDGTFVREVESWHPRFHPVTSSEKPEGYFRIAILAKP